MKRSFLIVMFLAPLLMGTTPVTSEVQIVRISNSDYPTRIGKWKYTPTVIVCNGAPVVASKVINAVRWWKRHGHVFYNTITKDDPLNKCNSESPNGFITINVEKQKMFSEDDDMAVTHFYVDNETSEISWAKIYLKSSPLDRVMEHEIGHALGFMHSNHIGHLMHQSWLRGGWKDFGLRSSTRVDKIRQ